MTEASPGESEPDAPGEEDFVPLSALQHQLFCPRQCALIHLERLWAENVLTAEGRLMHENAHTPKAERRGDLKTLTAVPLSSAALRVTGVADVVELRRDAPRGQWRPFPVEYNRGRPKAHRADEVQLCAQAICLEEMFGLDVREGALFYGANRRRTNVVFDAELRALTARVAADVHTLFASGVTPRMAYDSKRCDSCSLLLLCRPKQSGSRRSVAAWLARRIESDG
jgi:CRISPR-associated exonuclease Cas4